MFPSSSFILFCVLHASQAHPAHHHRHPAASTKSSLARHVTDFVIFGDSYTDSCNAYNGGYFADGKPPKDVTTFPHCQPGEPHRADGGRAWPEWIRVDQHQVESSTSPPGGDPVNAQQWNISNYAQGGATCDNVIWKRAPIPDIGEQILLYQTHYNQSKEPATHIQTDPASTMACIFIGTNDVSLSFDQPGSPQQEADCLLRRLQTLHDLGFRQMLIIQVIDLEDSPQHHTPQNYSLVRRAVQKYNRLQASLFPRLTVEWNDGSTIDVFPAYRLFKAYHNRPSEYGFTNITGGCDGCNDLDDYIWANALHPSDRAFHIFARKLVRFVSDGARGHELIEGSGGL